MKQSRPPTYLATITGTHRRPSTMDVISLCRDADRLIRRSRQAQQRHLAIDDCRALLDQVEWLDAAAASEENMDSKATYERLSAELLQLRHRVLREADRGDALSNLLYSAGAALADTASYAARVAFNAILVSLLYALLVFALLLVLHWAI